MKVFALLTALATAAALRRQQPKSYRQILRNGNDVQYFADFKIGGQTIAGIFDTGSFEIVVRSSRCSLCLHPTSPYNHEKSNTFVKNGTITHHNYGSGPCETMLGYDTVAVGPSLIAKDQPIWEITRHNIPVLNRAKFAAIVGIGPKYGYNSERKTLLMNYHVDEFSICLGQEPGSNGFLTWGPSAKAEEEVAKAKVYGKHHWATKMSKVYIQHKGQEKQVDPTDVCPNGCAAIIDSGTSLIAAPRAALQILASQLGAINEDCSNFHELPNLLFSLDGQDFELPPRAYVMRMRGAELKANDIWDLLFFKPRIRKSEQCMPAFMEMNFKTQMGDMWILGMPFFREFHTTFDREKQIMKFAKAGPDCEPMPFFEKKEAESEDTVALVASRANVSKPLEVDMQDLIPPRLSLQYDDAEKEDMEI